MKVCLLLVVLFVNLESAVKGQVQFETEEPRVDRVAFKSVMIKRVKLTRDHTILYMKYTRSGGTGNIRFLPTARLIVDNGKRSYKYIRSESISEYSNRHVPVGEGFDFIVYFQRIDPGFTSFDLFECNNFEAWGDCFNFFGIHINNPSQVNNLAEKLSEMPGKTDSQGRTNISATAVRENRPDRKSFIPANDSVIQVKGVIRDIVTKRPVFASITYHRLPLTSKSEPGRVWSAGGSGTYQIRIPLPGTYLITLTANGYFSQSINFTMTDTSLVSNFELVPIVVGAKLILKDVLFDASKSDLKDDSFSVLEELVAMLKANPQIHIRLEGHTDFVGDFNSNLELSRARVNEVKKYLVNKGLSTLRISTVGFGSSRPVNSNRKLNERPENRRVELVVVKTG